MRIFLKIALGFSFLFSSFAFINTANALDIVFAEDRPDLRTLDPRITQSRHEEMLIVNMFDQLVAIRGDQVVACIPVAARGKLV